jgi:tripartite-type tricarboxylate transporter receptor subunit TctC
MKSHLARLVGTVVAGALAASQPLTSAGAQSYPTRNVTIVVPLAAGTGMDAVARIYGELLGKALGKPVIIENQPGAALMLAVQNVARAKPDGHTLVISTSSPMATNQTLYKKLSYNPDTDFTPIALYLKSPFVLIVRPQSGITSLKDYIAKARAAGDKPFTYGSPGNGTLLHLIVETLKQEFDFKADHVPYRNSPQIVTDVIGGHLSSAMSETGAALSLIRDGKVKALAISSTSSHPRLPDVPPMATAADKPGFEAVSWHVLLAPAATPKPIVDRLRDEMRKVTSDAAFQKKVTEIGLMPIPPMTPDEMTAYIKAEQVRWGAIVRKLGLAGSR